MRLDIYEMQALRLVEQGKDREAHPIVLGALLWQGLIAPGRWLSYGQSYKLTEKGKAVLTNS